MACTSCTDTTPCGTPDCGCKFEVDAGCIRYSGESLGAAEITEGDTLATILETLNTKFETYGPGDYVDVIDEAAGDNCEFGGLKFILYSGLDDTIKETKYICGIGAEAFVNGTGTTGKIVKFVDADTVGDSIMSESGTVITVAGTLKITGGAPGAGKVLKSDADGDGSWENITAGDVTSWVGKPETIMVSIDESPLTTGTSKKVFRMPFAMTLTGVRVGLTTAQSSGSIITIDINQSGVSVLSTKLTIDNTEKTSTTAATPAVISTSALTDDAEITIDVDQVGDGTGGILSVVLIGTRA